jgi:hydrogenase expression/formation protein HypE
MPKLDFEVITMGHGSGGLLTQRLLESGVFNVLKNEYLDRRHDGVLIQAQGRLAFTTDSYVVSPIFFPGGNIGDLAVNGSVNDLAMCGAIPKYLSLSFILEEGLPVKDLWEIILSIKAASDKAGVQIVTGDTKVVEKGKGDRIFINTSGIGELHPRAQILHERIREGDHIIVSGPIAAHGIAILSQRQGLEFETTIESDTAPVNHLVRRLLDRAGERIHFMRDPTRGGVATVLNEIAHQSKVGIGIRQSDIPVQEQVEGACELLGLDPLYVANEGIFIAVVSPDISREMVMMLREMTNSEAPNVIGEITAQHPGQVILTSTIGGRRVLNLLTGEQLPRIC